MVHCCLICCMITTAVPVMSLCEALTLDECISLAKRSNLDLIRAQTAVEKAETGIVEAHSVYYPYISISSNYSYGKDQMGEGNYSSSISARYQLFKGDSRAGVRIARARVEVARENFRLSESTVLYEVKRAFFQILQQQQQVSLIETILERRKQSLAIIKLRYNVGRESFPAVKEAEANLFRAEYDQMKAEEELSLSKISLNLLLGRPKKQEVVAVYEERDIVLPALEEIINYAKSQRPEMRVEEFNKSVLEEQVIQARSSYLPSLSLSSSYGVGGNEFLEQRSSWSVGAGISMPIFDSPRKQR
jgi:outer membrane protein